MFLALFETLYTSSSSIFNFTIYLPELWHQNVFQNLPCTDFETTSWSDPLVPSGLVGDHLRGPCRFRCWWSLSKQNIFFNQKQENKQLQI